MEIFGSGPRLDEPRGDVGRQAVAALRGYGYQIYASALAWLALGDSEMLYLEVAEDFAVATREAIAGTQVKDTAASGKVTLRSEGVRAAIDAFVDLVQRNPGRAVSLHYLTTSEVGLERSGGHRIGYGPALLYWRRAAAGADVAPLRDALSDLELGPATKAYLATLSASKFQSEFLSRIHWHCGAPRLQDVRGDLEAGLVEYVSTYRRLPSHVGRSLVSAVVEQVLLTAVSEDARRLRRADLLTLVDQASRVSVPLDQLAGRFGDASGPGGFVRSSLLLPAAELPLPRLLAPRAELVEEIDRLRSSSGAVFAVGATGLGKSLAARLVADRRSTAWSIVDFRDLDNADTAARLSLLLGELAVAPSTGLILDDLNEAEDPRVRGLLARVLASLQRRDGSAVVTAYWSPAPSTLYELASGGVPVVEIPYLSEEEVADLVVRAGGDARYAVFVHRAASGGHPQLTMGAVQQLSQSGWSRSTLATLLGGEPGSEIAGERRAVRRRLMTAMPAEAITLLLRTSLVGGGFDRPLALALGELSPPVPFAGLVLDRLVGPWIEPLRQDRLRVSPLLANAANEVFSQAECRAVHHCIGERMLRRTSLSVLDADMMLRHVLGSGDAALAATFANTIVTCDEEVLEKLAPFTGALQRLAFAEPILPGHAAASALLRLAQLLVLLPQGSPESVRQCWDALERERVNVRGRDLFESTILAKLLMHSRAASIFPHWLDLLLRLAALASSNEILAAAERNYQALPGNPPDMIGLLLAGQVGSIRAVSSFRSLMARLDREAPDLRERCLSAFRPGRGDISILVNHGWLSESREPGFDWTAAAADYAACAEMAMSWGDAGLAVRCAIARAICIDENGDDRDQALACLAEAERRYGFDVALGRARAKIHWRRRDHAAALPLLAAAADAGGQEPLERLFIAREAGISAAELGDWAAAEQWFERAHAAAALLPQVSIKASAIGLLADIGHAACRAGNPRRALRRFREAVALLPDIDPDGTLAEAYCHRIVRHAVLWFFRTVSGLAEPDDREVGYPPGCGSNMEPREEIRTHPVAVIDHAVYLLAGADLALPEPSGYHDAFREDLSGGPLLVWEVHLAVQGTRKMIGRHEVDGFVSRVRQHAATSSLIRAGIASDPPDILSVPGRGTVPYAVIDADAPKDVRWAAEDFVLTFAIMAALAGRFDSIDAAVEAGLAAPELVALRPILGRIAGDVTELASFSHGAAIAVNAMRRDLHGRPAEFLWCGIWLLLHVRVTELRELVLAPVVAWIFDGWIRFVCNGRFLLSAPNSTVPPVERILAQAARTPGAAAELILAAAPATATRIPRDIRTVLEEMADGVASSPVN